jgi:hypothetical protein
MNGPLMRRPDRAHRQNACDVPLIVRTGVDVAGRRDRVPHAHCHDIDRFGRAGLADQARCRIARIDRRLADAAKSEPDL